MDLKPNITAIESDINLVPGVILEPVIEFVVQLMNSPDMNNEIANISEVDGINYDITFFTSDVNIENGHLVNHQVNITNMTMLGGNVSAFLSHDDPLAFSFYLQVNQI